LLFLSVAEANSPHGTRSGDIEKLQIPSVMGKFKPAQAAFGQFNPFLGLEVKQEKAR
jgi:hypothetical protein